MQSSYKRIKYLTIAGCLLFSFALTIRSVMLVVNVEGQSMYPTLQDGDKILVLRRLGSGKRLDWFDRCMRRGQVAIFSPWHGFTRSDVPQKIRQLFVKRIVGMENDIIVTSITDLSYGLQSEHIAAHDAAGNRTWHIPPKHVFVRGDNLPSGSDSLTWGPIPYHAVRGIMLMKLSSKYYVSAKG